MKTKTLTKQRTEDREQRSVGTNGTAQPPVIRMIRRVQIRPSELQPRKHFGEEGIAELVSSFKEHGFDATLSHLLLRPINEVKIEHEEDSKHFFIRERSTLNAQRSTSNGGDEWETVGTADSLAEAEILKAGLEQFELIAGERRWRAAEAMNLESVPAIVSEMDDLHVLIKQLIENLQRESLNAMEEALAYQRLIDMGESRQAIADDVGMSIDHVGQLLALCKLNGTPAGDAVATNKISKSHGRVLASVPSARTRDELLAKIFNPPDGSPAPWAREALEAHIKLDYQRDLRSADFDTRREDLVKVEIDGNGKRLWGGACGDCPFNSANMKEDGQRSKQDRSAMCTNLECWQMKEIAAYEEWRTEVRDQKSGVSTLPHGENAALWNDYGDRLRHNSLYIELDWEPAESEVRAGISDDAVKPWKELVQGQKVPLVLGRDAHGVVHEMALHDLAKKAAHLNGHLIFRDSERESRTDKEISTTANRPAPKSDEQIRQENVLQKATKEAKSQTEQAEIAAIVKAAEGKVRRRMLQIPKPFWSHAALSMATLLAESGLLGDVVARRQEQDPDSLATKVNKMQLGELFGLVVECLVVAGGEGSAAAWAEVFKVDLKKIRKSTTKATKRTKKKKK